MGDDLKPLPYNEVSQEMKWNAESVFESPEAWEVTFATVEAKLSEIGKFKGHLGDGPDVLADWFDYIENLMSTVGRLNVYASMSYNCDTSNKDAMAMMGRMRGLWGKAAGMTAFSDPELLAIGKDTLLAWVDEEAHLADLSHYFDNLFRQQEHVLSPEVEEVLGMLQTPFAHAYSTYNALNSSDLSFKPAVLSKN